MQQPSPPESLAKYLAEGLPKQDTETLRAIQTYIETFIAYQTQPVTTDELPDRADPVDDNDAFQFGQGTVVRERVKSSNDNSSLAHPDGFVRKEYTGFESRQCINTYGRPR